MKTQIYIILLLCCFKTVAQKRDYNWVFGDSVGINFNTNPPSVDTNRIIGTEEPSASISDENGNLLFYVGTETIDYNVGSGAKKYVVRGSNNSIILGGDSLAGHSSVAQGLLIIPDPYDSVNYYIFHIKYPGNVFYYSTLDKSLNSGFGQVVSSNTFLKNSVYEMMHAVKAANVKDWWIVVMGGNLQYDYLYTYKLDSTGLSYKASYLLPPGSGGGAGQMIFSQDGSKLLISGLTDATDMYDFDRCLGVFSNRVIIDSVAGIGWRYGCSFSPSRRYVYLSTLDSLWQFDTQAANIPNSKILLFTPHPDYYIGQHMSGPDGKIYIAGYMYPYNPSLDSLETHLSVIENPDASGLSCNLAPHSFSLSVRKAYSTLPNMPNYNLGALENLNCDSILALTTKEITANDFVLYPNPLNNIINLQLKHNVEDEVLCELYNLSGLKWKYCIFSSNEKFQIDISDIPEGMYFVKLTLKNNQSFCRKVCVVH